VNNSDVLTSDIPPSISQYYKPVAAEGRIAHNNVWKGANGMASNTWNPCDVFDTIPHQPLP
jgi:hypothetical protein